MTDTPETDDLARGNHVVPTEFAEKLERERDRYKLACDQYSEDEMMNSLQSLKSERDRLAEALQKVVTSWDEATWLDENEFEAFREALTTLNQPKP